MYLQAMKKKVITLYARNIFFPLMRMKREIIQTYNERKDYDQVICGKDLSNQGIIDSLTQLIFHDLYKRDEQKFEQYCVNQISDINQKFYTLLD